jgi:hypothetical protein
MIAFPNGTSRLDGVKKIVEHFKDVVEYYEPRNEPNGGSNGTNFVSKEMRPFYETVKAVSPNLKVMGPGTVSIGPGGGGLGFIEDFFKADGGNYIDAFSFHFYNGLNGDMPMGKRSLDALLALMKKYNAQDKELWQTEQGYFACVYGDFQPRHQGQWTMLEMMLFEQYHLPKEHNHLWYDFSHGFWDFPTWWENDEGGLNPAAPLMRVYAEEVFGTNFAKAYDFGPAGNKIWLGSLFTGKDKNVAMFLSAGDPRGQLTVKVTGGDKLHLTSAFGVESDVPVSNGLATFNVPELPVWVDLAKGQSIEVIPTDWGKNLAMEENVTVDAMKQPPEVMKKNDDPSAEGFAADPAAKINNGVFEDWYYDQQKTSEPWDQLVEKFPTWVRMNFPKPTEISRVVIHATPPWQKQGSLLDYELQYWDKTQWKTIEHVKEDAKTFGFYSPATRTSVDSFYNDRCVFQHQFKPITTDKIRLLIHETTYGGSAAAIMAEAGGQGWGKPMYGIREIEVYNK